MAEESSAPLTSAEQAAIARAEADIAAGRPHDHAEVVSWPADARQRSPPGRSRTGMAEQIDVWIGAQIGDDVRLTLATPPFDLDGPAGYAAYPATIEVKAGPFHGSFSSHLYVGELEAFRRGLADLYDTLAGVASLSALEGTIEMKLAGNGLGHVQITGYVVDEPARKNRLQFDFDLDQTFLPSIRDALRAVSRSASD